MVADALSIFQEKDMSIDYQQPSFYKFNEDSLHLSKFILKNLETADLGQLLEVGIGSGIISLEVLNGVNSIEKLTAYEREESFRESLEENLKRLFQKRDLALKRDNIEIRYEDFLSFQNKKSNIFDLIYFNPPYFFEGDGRISPDLKKEGCRRIKREDFIKWLEYSSVLLKDGGNLFFCHRLKDWNSKDFNLSLVEMNSSNGAYYFHWRK